jgi:hypothetical protein
MKFIEANDNAMGDLENDKTYQCWQDVITSSRGAGGKSTHFMVTKIFRMIDMIELFQAVKVEQGSNYENCTLVFGTLKEDFTIRFTHNQEAMPSLYEFLCDISSAQKTTVSDEKLSKILKKLMHVGKKHTHVLNKTTGPNKELIKCMWKSRKTKDRHRTDAINVTLCYLSCHFLAADHMAKNGPHDLNAMNFFNNFIDGTTDRVQAWMNAY